MAMMGSGTARGDNRAREAAEAAVSSPLLEDVNLSGANGMLVNVTAGMDLRPASSAGRRHGEAVRLRGRERGLGTVIDPEMRDEIRVTVVATGIGRPVAGQMPQQDGRRMTAIPGGRNHRVPTLDDLHVPTYIRNQRDPQSVTPRLGRGRRAERRGHLDARYPGVHPRHETEER